jgi:hypothetical protein
MSSWTHCSLGQKTISQLPFYAGLTKFQQVRKNVEGCCRKERTENWLSGQFFVDSAAPFLPSDAVPVAIIRWPWRSKPQAKMLKQKDALILDVIIHQALHSLTSIIFFWCGGGGGLWNWGLNLVSCLQVLMQQALYCFSYTSSLFCCGYFRGGVLKNYLPGLASNHDPPNLSLLNS